MEMHGSDGGERKDDDVEWINYSMFFCSDLQALIQLIFLSFAMILSPNENKIHENLTWEAVE